MLRNREVTSDTVKKLAMLKNVDWSGRHEDSSKMKTAFSRAWAYSGMSFSVLRECKAKGDPTGAKRRGDRKAEAPCSAPTSAGRPADEVVL